MIHTGQGVCVFDNPVTQNVTSTGTRSECIASADQFDVLAVQFTLPPSPSPPPSPAAPLSYVSAGCQTLESKTECISSKDGRTDYMNQVCTWCCGIGCRSGGGHRQMCQPNDWLMQQSDYIGYGQNGIGLDNCPSFLDGHELLYNKKSWCTYNDGNVFVGAKLDRSKI